MEAVDPRPLRSILHGIRVAKAPFALGVSYLVEDDQSQNAFRHLCGTAAAQLEIGKIAGVTAGLHNLGMIVTETHRVAKGVMLLIPIR